VDIVYKRELEQAENRDQVRHSKIEEFRERFANPYVAADRALWMLSSSRGIRARN